MSEFLDRKAILEVDDTQTEEVEVPEWGGKVLIKGLSGAERDSYEQSMVQGKGKNARMNMKNARAKLVALTTVVPDEEGGYERVFKSKGDVKRLGKKSGKALERVFSKARKLSGLTKEDMEELAGNSKDDQSEDSILD